ncbi:hypothetical protein AKA01nite_08550 [Alkalibacterium kapii]|uniref:AI-2E family transporter n=1 Tax=Alkalibacterium kapii TaxID=426704 RepID=A0A511AV57_9LACT|nr:hypothetical protein AKA01nite_08550 [Alkalibacterium kapii]
MFKVLQKVFIVLSVIVAIYVLITSNYSLFPIPSFLLLLSILVRALYDFKKGRKIIGVSGLAVVLILFLMLIHVL